MKKISVLVICTLLLVSCGQKEVVVSPPPLKTGTGAPVSKIESASVVEKQSNTKEFGPYRYIEDFTYSPDGKSLAFMAENDGKQFDFNNEGKSFIVKDGIEIKNYDSLRYPTYSPDGKSFAFRAKKDGKYFIIKDGVESSKKYGYIDELTYSPDGKSFAFMAENDGQQLNDGKSFIIKDGVESEKYEFIYQPKFSPDGKNFVFTATKNGKTFIIKNGIELTVYDSASEPIFSPDGKNMVFVNGNDQQRLIVYSLETEK